MKPTVQGEQVPAALLADLEDSSHLRDDPSALQHRLEQQGYIFCRGAVPQSVIEAARQEVFGRLFEVGEIAAPEAAGIATGVSRRESLCEDLGQFWRSVCLGPALRLATHGQHVRDLTSQLLGEPSVAHDFMFLRPGRVGQNTRLHYDLPFFARGSNRILTAWLALGTITPEDGGLMVIPGSRAFEDLVRLAQSIDYDSPDSPTVQVMGNTVEFVRERETQMLTTVFQPGDVVVFDMLTMHGTFDNNSPTRQVRLSCDVRWQPVADPVDPRYQGDHPPGTTGAGYGELNGAKPLTLDWHTR